MENVSQEAPTAHELEGARAAGVLSDARVRYLYLLAGACLIGVIFCWLQFSTPAICCGDFDGYYHIKWSQTLWQSMRAGHFPPRFTWLPLTTLNERDYVDHHLLFHILQIPFTWLGDLRLAAKISAALFATLAVLSCYWLTLRYRIRYPFVWLLALLGSSAPFLFRMNMTKAMSVSIVLLVVGIHLLWQRKYLWLLPLAFVFTETYDMFVLLALACVIWTCVVAWSEQRFEWRPVVWVGVGIVAGLIINPYFPHNVKLLVDHVVMKATRGGFKVAVGNEWYPYESWDFFRNCAVAFAAMFVGYIAFNWEDRKRAARPLFLLIFATALLVANARWRRFAEYWPPFAVLFAAFAVQACIERMRASSYGRLPADVQAELQPFLDGQDTAATRAATQRREEWGLGAAIVAAVALATSLGFTAYAETKEIGDSAPPEAYRAGSEWMRANIPAGQVVFNTDWDDFPKLFYYDPAHAYVSGLDPTYLYDANPDLSQLYERITLGKERDPGPLIRDRFGARYVFTDNEDVHGDFYDAAMDSGWFEEVYTDDDCTVLHIRDVKGTPPPANTDGNTPPDEDSNTPDDNSIDDEEDAPGTNQTLAPPPRAAGRIG